MRRSLVLAALGLLPVAALAQGYVPPAYPVTPGAERLQAAAQWQQMRDASPLRNVAFRSVGPTIMSGRVVDVDVNPRDPMSFYVAYATGGVWKTVNGGQSFTPVFENEAVITVGDIAVDWARGERVWVGTGEVNSSRSSYAGVGVYVSQGAGTTGRWTHRGLSDTHHIGRILLDPRSGETALVASLGPLYSPDGQRGVFMTRDGGRTWRNTLPARGNVGAVDLARDPSNPRVVYAALWERTRRAWDFTENGPGSGLYKSTDGGATWTRLNMGSSFPTTGAGRIGVDVGQGGVVYVVVDNNDPKPETPPAARRAGEPEPLTRDRLRTMTRDELLAVSPQVLTAYLDENGFPQTYTATSILNDVRAGTIEPRALVEYLEDANANLFNKPVKGAELYRSDDGGRTFRKTHEGQLDGLHFSYGYYFSVVRADPADRNKVYVVAFDVVRSDDGGKTFTNLAAPNVHVDHHALALSPRRGHLVNGNDGGVNVSYDDGKTWFKANTPAVGQFYFVATDNQQPYNVYGGLQDNGVWMGPSTYRPSRGWAGSGRYPYTSLGGGDGMQVQVDDRDPRAARVYSGSQFGFYSRQDVDLTTSTPSPERPQVVRPQHGLAERPNRFNWQTPILISPHSPEIVYFGSHRLNRSLDRGVTFTAISGDLTRGGTPGDVPYGTLSAIDESPKRFGLLVTGSDDGRVSLSKDGGATWQDVSAGLPEGLWVSEVVASRHDENRLYVALNGYRFDHMDAYVFRSDDLGQTWRRTFTGLPKEPVNALVEDPANAGQMYVGTDAGVYFSNDGGQTVYAFAGGLPRVPVHDLKIQARDRDLVVGTHGRSIYIADLDAVQTLTPELLARPLRVYPLQRVMASPRWGTRDSPWDEAPAPTIPITYWASAAGPVTVTIADSAGTTVATLQDAAERGFNTLAYDGRVDEARLSADARARYTAAQNGTRYLRPGRYTVTVTGAGATERTTLDVQAPPARRARPLDPEARERDEAASEAESEG